MKPFNLEEYLANPSRKLITKDGEEARYDLDYCDNVKDVLNYLKKIVEE